ncbi:MAG: helix-turn-helix domain-containing protein [Kiritimatiellae bacterium]|nr:helix-turn-helix domain-containing protein [Kiritimatiellia bacterium]
MEIRKRRDVLLAMTPYSPRRSDGVRRFALEAGWNLIDSTRLVGGLDGLSDWRGDGVIATLRDDPATTAFVRRLSRARIPVVDLTIQRPDIKVPRVCLDNAAVGRVAAEHFKEFNHRNAAWFSTHWMNVHAQRFAGFCVEWNAGGSRSRATAADAQRRVPPDVGHDGDMVPERWVLSEGVPPGRRNDARAVARWLSARLNAAPKPLALFCHCIEDASRLLAECGASGIRVPEEIAVLTAGDDPMACEMQPVPLSCVPLQGERHGYEAAALLQRLMDGEPPPRSPCLVRPGDVDVRASTNWTAAADPLVAKALALVAGNLSRQWGVAQLSRELGVPPLRIGVHFKAELGRTPGEEILRQRLSKARTLLRETGMTVEEIAVQCGFCHASYLSNLFRREIGMTPRKWRNATLPDA